jgi:D-beta-D-heptose 7-phosphate kinase/D-beta-D-heptose 1-phosphate adenosyltransferase
LSDQSVLVTLVEKMRGVKVLCVGDVMLDRFVHGEVERISPEAPIPVLRIERESAMLGGAGNVVRNLAALGAHTAFVSVVGDDAAGHEVTALLGEIEGICPDVAVEKGRRTSIKTRFLGGGQQMLRADRETVAPLGDTARRRLADAAVGHLRECGVVVLSDYGKGVLSGGVAAEIINAAEAAGRPVVVDPKGADYGRYRGAGVLTPNRKELMAATGLPAGGDDEIIAAGRRLIHECGIGAVLVTRSQDGMTLVPAQGGVVHLPAEAREVFDVSGAGDTVVAALAAALAAGAALPQAAALANTAAGIVVGKVGTAVAYADEVTTALHHQDIASAEHKVLSLESALDRVALWRRQGLKVGFTNGCFDLLHPGHVALLGQARAACDRLLVGLNSDASVARLKGPGRPVQSEAARATVLASLTTVDTVVIFAEDTPMKLIEAFRPDVLVKGADYTLDKVVGADFVQSYGGRVVLARLEEGHSTTATIARIGK